MAPLVCKLFVTPLSHTLNFYDPKTHCKKERAPLVYNGNGFVTPSSEKTLNFDDFKKKAPLASKLKIASAKCKREPTIIMKEGTLLHEEKRRSSVDEGTESMFLQQHASSRLQSYLRFMEGILEMSRPQNLVPTMALVLMGGWLGGGRSVEVLMRPGQVWIAVGCTALITAASMLVNDIFDFRSGTDQANCRTSPLLSGQVHPYHVELVANCLYGASIFGLCYLEPVSLRSLIGVIIVATYIYTPILKNLTMVKNMVVSGIISSSIFVGALAIGGKEQLQNPVVTMVALFIFLCFLSRELLMDVGDMVGDKAAGVNTLAVRFGGQIGTLTASFCLVAANALLVSLLVVKTQGFATIGTLILLPLHAKMLSLCKELGATKEALILESIQDVVQQSMVHIGFGVLVLALMA